MVMPDGRYAGAIRFPQGHRLFGEVFNTTVVAGLLLDHAITGSPSCIRYLEVGGW